MILGALEGGGTKMVCAVGDELGHITERAVFPTETPEITIPKLIDFYKQFPICALGIGSFGPVDLDKKSATYGYITSTPKLAWKNCDFLGAFKDALGIPCGFDTDVNVAALGEAVFGCMKGLDSGIYMTVGTGIGVGVYSNSSLVHGMLHPEGGHMLIKHHPDDPFAGGCPYHGDCLEGLASGPAMEKRAGCKAVLIPADAFDWDLEAYYVAQSLVNYIMVMSPQKIVLGGGVMSQEHLIPKIREQVKKLLGGYINTPQIEDIDHYIVPASLGGDQAIMGCMKLAYDAACSS